MHSLVSVLNALKEWYGSTSLNKYVQLVKFSILPLIKITTTIFANSMFFLEKVFRVNPTHIWVFLLTLFDLQGENDGIWAWTRFNQLFNHLPLAALIEKKIICMHGGIGRSIHLVEQIEKIERPITMDAGSLVLMDLLW